MSYKNREEEVCRHPAEKVRRKRDPRTSTPSYWCIDCRKMILNVPKRHCEHAKKLDRCGICAVKQKGLHKFARGVE